MTDRPADLPARPAIEAPESVLDQHLADARALFAARAVDPGRGR